MMMTTNSPSASMAAQSELAQIELLETAERLVGEGLDWRAVLTAFATSASTIVINRVGPEEVPRWFARAAAQTMHFGKAE